MKQLFCICCGWKVTKVKNRDYMVCINHDCLRTYSDKDELLLRMYEKIRR
jgi:hypothetical protein